MHVVRKIDDKSILFLEFETNEKSFDIAYMYPEFNPDIMEYGYADMPELPEFFEIDNHQIVEISIYEAIEKGLFSINDDEKIVDGEIVEKSLEELVSQGLLEIADDEKIVDGEVVLKTLKEQVAEGIVEINEPFEFVNDEDQIDYHPLNYLIDNGLIKTESQVELSIKIINDSLEKEVQETYSPGYESKLTKGYIEWISDGKPEGDSRFTAYNTMQLKIASIRDKFKLVRNELKSIKAAINPIPE